MPLKVQLGRSNVPYSCTPFFNQSCRHCCTKHFHNFAKNKAKAVLICKLQCCKRPSIEGSSLQLSRLNSRICCTAWLTSSSRDSLSPTTLFVADHSLGPTSPAPHPTSLALAQKDVACPASARTIMTFRLCISDSPAWHATRSGSHRSSWTMGRSADSAPNGRALIRKQHGCLVSGHMTLTTALFTSHGDTGSCLYALFKSNEIALKFGGGRTQSS